MRFYIREMSRRWDAIWRGVGGNSSGQQPLVAAQAHPKESWGRSTGVAKWAWTGPASCANSPTPVAAPDTGGGPRQRRNLDKLWASRDFKLTNSIQFTRAGPKTLHSLFPLAPSGETRIAFSQKERARSLAGSNLSRPKNHVGDSFGNMARLLSWQAAVCP